MESGKDVIDGGGGTDTLVIDGPALFEQIYDDADQYYLFLGTPAVRANLGLETLRIGDSVNRSSIVSIENIETGSGNDSINGSSGDNFIRTGDGANVVYALGGDDTIIGGSKIYFSGGDEEGTEILNGGSGDDLIDGMGAQEVHSDTFDRWRTLGEDVMVGGDGDDTLIGGGAFETMTGGSGRDVFTLTDRMTFSGENNPLDDWLLFGTTTIIDFERGKDIIRIETDHPLTYAGETRNGQVGELSFYKSGGDTIIVADFDVFTTGNAYTITLSDYTGPLSASDFEL